MQKVCKICGAVFETTTKANVCSDVCRKKAAAIAHRDYVIRHRTSQIRNQSEILNQETKTSVEIQGDILITTLEKTIVDNLELLDAVRDELSKVVNELKAKQSAYDSKDSEILHAMESATTDSALLNYAKLARENRKGRRDFKNYIIFLLNILKYIPQNAKQSFLKSKENQNCKNIYYSIKY